MAIEVASLHIYPLKGAAAIDLPQTEFTELGLRYDREWMLVNQKNVFITQRQHPELALVQSHIGAEAITMCVPNVGSVTLPLDRTETNDNEVIKVDVFKKSGSGLIQGNGATELFSDFLHMPVKLVRVNESRHIKPECVSDAMRATGVSEETGFADGFSILLTSEASLKDLNSYLPEGVNIGSDRFRPNIVVRGKRLQAYEEDCWRELCIGNLQAFVARACARCPVPNVDQQTGFMPGRGEVRYVTEALRASRAGIEYILERNEETGKDVVVERTGEYFGQNMAHVFDEGLVVKVGDKVNVLERADEPNVFIEMVPAATADESSSELLPQQERLRRHQALECA